ncbi:MAG: glycosyltransferase [Nitrospirota bacterium]|nr:glycosyltransferase [Nitrospirota bacterium]
MNKGSAGIKILAYHDIADKGYLNLEVPEKIFRRHVRYLVKNNYNLISLEDAANLLESCKKVPRKTVVITFDDGYKSVYHAVFPVVKEFGVPITVFLATGSIGSSNGNLPPFVDAVAHAIRNTAKRELDLSEWNFMKYPLRTAILKEKAIKEVNEYSKNLSTINRKKFLEFIFRHLNVDAADYDLKNKMLSWEEIIEMNKEGISFGAHTHTHPSLSRIPIEEAREEILLSKKLMEERLDKEISTFAYPYGSDKDINGKIRDIVEDVGFKCACVLKDGINRAGDDLFLLKRACVTNQIKTTLLSFFSEAVFSVQMTGFLDFIHNRRIRKMRCRQEEKKKIKVLYIIDQLKAGAGTERHLVRLATLLDKERFNTAISFFEGAPGTIHEEIRKQGVPVKDLNLSRIYSHRALVQGIRLGRFIRENKIDIVQTFHFKSDTFGVVVAKLAGAQKIISSRRDTGDLKKPRQIFLNKLMNRFIDRFIMVCNTVGRKVYENEGVPEHKTQTIYNGVDIKRFSHNSVDRVQRIREKLRYSESDFVVGTSAIFRPEKAYHVFFEGIEKVLPSIKSLKVLVLGFGPTKDYFESYCSNGPLKNIVKFMGFVEDVERFLPLMDVFCLVPNKNEGFSNAILEAMSAGRPVIASDVGGNAEAVIHNETGIIIPPDDSDRLSQAILELYNNPERRVRMGVKARERAASTFSLEKMIKEHERFYEEVFKGN